MNPSDEVDGFLRDAGAKWRASQPSPPEPDLERMTGGPRRLRRWVPALAAASVAVIAAGVIALLPGDDTPLPEATVAGENENRTGDENRTGRDSPRGNESPSGNEGPGGNEGLLVRDGDKVEATGEIIAAPGKPVVFCAPHAVRSVGYPPGQEPAPSCPADFQVQLTGFDVGKLTGSRKGVHYGTARLVGVWQDGTIAVQEQSAAVRSTPSDADEFTDLPCAPPSGGWKPGHAGEPSQAVQDYVKARPDQLSELWIGWPNGLPTTPSASSVSVLVVQVVRGDVDQVRGEVAALHEGNLCVAKGKYSQSDSRVVATQLGDLAQKGYGISTATSVSGDRPADVQLKVVDERVLAEFRKIGLDKLSLNPAVRPLR